MLSITPISAGAAGVNYLLRQSGCRDRNHERDDDEREPEPEPEPEKQPTPEGRAARSGADYLIASREAEGSVRWWGRGVGDVGVDTERAASDDDIRTVFGRLEHAETGEPLGSPPRRYLAVGERLERALAAEPDAPPERRAEIEWRVRSTQRRAVGYYDLTFSPVKSVSVLWAALVVAGRDEEADLVWQAHQAGVQAALTYLQDEAGYSRAGYHGRAKDGRSVGEHVASRSWTAVEFDHSLSRAADPQLHTHVALLNRARSDDDREWRAVDSRGLFHARTAAGAVYERTYEEQLHGALGIEFAPGPDGRGREILSIPPEVRTAFSQRRADVVAAVDAFIADYTDRFGHHPAPYEVTVAAQRAARSTREPKQDVAPEDLALAWADRLDGVLAGVDAARHTSEWPAEPRAWDRDAVIAAAVHDVQSARATWTHYDLLAAIDAKLPSGLGLEPGEHHDLLEDLAARAESLDAGVVVLTPGELVPTPAALRRSSDGRPRFRPHRDERFATLDQLDAEERLLALTRAGGAPMLTDQALAEVRGRLDDLGLDDTQREAVIGILGSPRRAEALIGPAGTGKSFTMAALSEAWREHHQAPALGVATSQVAANVLAEDGVPAVNVARFLQRHEAASPGAPPAEPLPYGTLVVVDEAGMSATDQLDRIRAVVAAAHGKIVFTGDDRQLGPVGAGGVLAELAREHPQAEPGATPPGGPVHRLAEARRFRERWEGPASLQLRQGSIDGLQAYDEHGRIRAGRADDIVARATEAYLGDVMAGRRSLLIAPTNAEAAELSGRLRTELIGLGHVQPDPQAVLLRDGNRAGEGDIVQTRRNDWTPDRLAGSTARPVINRDIWRVESRDPDGGLRVVLIDGDGDVPTRVRLDPDYVARHVTLSYATTVHAAQGRTVDTAHTLVDSGLSRDALYVAMTRGREANTAWIATVAEVDDDQHLEPLRADYMAVLSDIVEREVGDRTATEVLRDEAEHYDSLLALGVVWSAVGTEYRRDVDTDRLLTLLGPERTDAVVDEPGYGRLLRTLHEIDIDGHDADDLLEQAVGRSELITAKSVSDVLRWRIRQVADEAEPPQDVEASSWADRTPRGDDEIARYLGEVATHMDRRQQQLGERAIDDPPAWAARHLGDPPEDPVDREDWIRRAGAVAAYHELYAPQRENLGPRPSRENPEARAAWLRAYRALGEPDDLRDYRAATDDELRVMIEAYDREEVWAPPYVADDLRNTRQRAADYNARAQITAAEAGVAPGDAVAELVERADAHRTFAAWQQERAEQLEFVHQARARWYEETATAREQAHYARRELADREPNPDDEIATGPLRAQPEPEPEPVVAPGLEAVHEGRNRDVDLADAVRRANAAIDELERRRVEREPADEPIAAEPDREVAEPQ